MLPAEQKQGHADIDSSIVLLRRLAGAVDMETLLQCLGGAIEATGVFEGQMYVMNDSDGRSLRNRMIRLPESVCHVEGMYREFRYPLENDDSVSESFGNRRLIILRDDETARECATRVRMKRWELRSMAIIPLVSGNECFGCLLGMHQNKTIDERDCAAAVALVNEALPFVRSMMRLDRFEQEKSALAFARAQHDRFMEFITTINNLTSDEPLYEAITSAFLERYPFEFCGVVLCEDEKLGVRRFAAREGAAPEVLEVCRRWQDYYRDNAYELDTADGATAVCFLQNTRISIGDVMAIRHMPMSARDRGALDLMGTPRSFNFFVIRRGDKPIGVLWLLSMTGVVEVAREDLQAIEQACNFIGTAIFNARLYRRVELQAHDIEVLNQELAKKVERLDDMARKDSLTGLYNFGFFREELLRRMNEYQRCVGEHFLSLVIIDIDHFKRFNDSYGHVSGNVALTTVSRLLREQARSMDIACRYGGEEFSVILPKCDIRGALHFAERLRQKIEATLIRLEDRTVSVTVSMGCAQFIPGEDQSSFVTRADQALYRAKAGGRNRVEADFETDSHVQ